MHLVVKQSLKGMVISCSLKRGHKLDYRRYLSEALDELESKVDEVQALESQIQILKVQVSKLQVLSVILSTAKSRSLIDCCICRIHASEAPLRIRQTRQRFSAFLLCCNWPMTKTGYFFRSRYFH